MQPQVHVLADGTEQTTIHFAVPREDHDTEYRIACLESMAQLHAGPGQLVPRIRSNDPWITNCPNCVRTKSHLDALVKMLGANGAQRWYEERGHV